VILSHCSYAIAQDLNFVHYSVNDGLPSSQVHDITQDKYGYLWFSTDQGLSRYDGYSFKSYTTSDGLTDNVTFKFYPQENGDIWCTTFNKSIFRISNKDPVFKPYPFNQTLLNIPDNFVTNCIYLSKDGSLYMSLVNGTGFIHIDQKGKTIYNSLNVYGSSNETAVFSDKTKKEFYFILTNDQKPPTPEHLSFVINSGHQNPRKGLVKSCFFEKSGKSVFIDYSGWNIRGLGSGSVRNLTPFEPISLGKLNDSLFWIGYRYGGVSIYDLKGNMMRSFLNGKSVTTLFTDHEGGLWLSTLNDGVFYTNNTQVVSYATEEPGNNWINNLEQDKNGNLWISYYNGDVCQMCSGRIIPKFKSSTKLPAILKYNKYDREMYFIADGKLFNTIDKNTLCKDAMIPINLTTHKNDSFLISSYKEIYIIHKGNKKNIRTGFRVNDIGFYRNEFYLGTGKGLYKLDREKTIEIKDPGITPTTKIVNIEAWGNTLLMATKGSGILIYEDNKIYRIGKELGLINDIVNRIYIQNDSVFWACTNSGLDQIVFKNKKADHILHVTAGTGLISNEVTDLEINNDTAWVGTREGLCSFPLRMLHRKGGNTNYFLEINDLKVNDDLLAKRNVISLKYNENRIEFNYRAISFIPNSPVLYRYKLSGLEKNWNYTTRLSSLYTALSPGSYTFCLQAKGNNNLWETGEQQFSFTISPPFWNTWWFRSSVAFVLVLMVYLFFKFRILTYNRDITRELLRQLLKQLVKKTQYVVFREQGKDIRISTNTIHFVQSDGNYIEIHTDAKKYVIRYKIGEFLKLVPDPLEYLRISRSCIIRLDKVQEKSKKEVTVRGEKIPVGETYLDQLAKIQF
jgi:ligand-binding sensor domain-containing protein